MSRFARHLLACSGLLLTLACLRPPPGSGVDPAVLLFPGSSGSSGSATSDNSPTIGSPAASYSGHENWNDYIENDGTTRFNATGTTCAGTATGGHSHCIHAGIMKTVTIANRTSCTGLSGSDSESALIWYCDDTSGTVKLTSTGFIPGGGLYQLIDFSTGTWKSLSLTVTDDAGSATTDLGQLWTNPIQLNLGGGTINANMAGNIYAFSASPGQQVVIGADRVAVVSNQTFRWLATGGGVDMITATSFKYLWIEPGWMDGATVDNRGINLNSVTYSVIQLARIQRTTLEGVYLQTCSNNLLNYVSVANNSGGNAALYMHTATYNTLGHIRTSNSASAGLYIRESHNNTIFNSISTNNQDRNLYLYESRNNAVVNFTSTNSANTGMTFSSNGHNNSVYGLALANQPTGLTTGSSSRRNTIVNIAATNTTTGLNISSTNNFFFDSVHVGANTTSCAGGGGTGIDGACNPEGTASSFTLYTGIDLSTSFPARINAADGINQFDSSGSASASAIFDWLHFDNLYRLWGIQGGTFADPAQRGRCTGTTCHIFDWRLNSGDSQIRNVRSQPTGNDALPHLWNVGNQTECETIDRATWAASSVCSFPGYFNSGDCIGGGGDWSTSKCYSVFLRNAHELLGDGLGNENGVCESYELCLYSPNIGAYQGEGSLTAIGAITNGTVQGVYLLQYATNGL